MGGAEVSGVPRALQRPRCWTRFTQSADTRFCVPKVRHRALQAVQALLTQLSRAPPAAAETLRQEVNAPLVGYLTSLLLKLAEGEARAGHAGSKALRATAMRSLKTLIDVVGDGDALAFFLPGVASGVCKALVLAGTITSPFWLFDWALCNMMPLYRYVSFRHVLPLC